MLPGRPGRPPRRRPRRPRAVGRADLRTWSALEAALVRLWRHHPPDAATRQRWLRRFAGLSVSQQTRVEAWVEARLTASASRPRSARRLAIDALSVFGLPQVILPALIRLVQRVRHRLVMRRVRAHAGDRPRGER
ncbi:hypothetical protein [Nitrospira sp. Kam-Ns4a]